ncbi:MAG TPA: M3 family metallopeptidase [Bacteroidales bacterium]|nr:M3 family metallopeptidase [Bacteroidales bacterium]HPS70737.1 M3 family metallopeptidase [Bacteroidales bacterium]
MKRTMTLIALASIFLFSACKKKEQPVKVEENPFFVEWTTPYGVPPFEKIKNEHYIPAFEKGMKDHDAEIAAICNNTEAPTFANTIEALEYSGELLSKVSLVFFNMTEAMSSDEIMKIADEITPKITKHGDNIMLNSKLFQRVKAVYDLKDSLGLDPVQIRLVEETYKGFVRGGANVPADKQARFREINEKLSTLTLQFGNNVLKASNEYLLVVSDVKRLEGMPANAIASALELGNSNEKTKGKYVFTIQLPSWEPLLQYCKDRELRKEMWTALTNRCLSGPYDNTTIINEIVNLRLERAQIMGFKSHADFTLDDCMAKTPKAVDDLLMKVWRPAIKKAKKEAAEYQAEIKKEGGNFKLEPWDWRYYSEKVRAEKFALNQDEVSQYFSLENVRNGIFMVANKLYGITFELNKNIPKYHKDVDVYEVKENGNVIAILYLDYYPRESKTSGAWMTNFREQYYTKDGKNVIPIVQLVLNSAKPTADAPSLLTFDQVETFFHEFGHGLHGMLTNCKYRSLSGTSVSRDFVELPSQIFEHWASHPEVLKMYAKHYKTGAVIPDELIKKIDAASDYGQGFMNTELIASSLLDMKYHSITEPTQIKLPDYEKNYLAGIGLIPEIIARHSSAYFKHAFSGGYDAGYYSYTWAAVLDNDAFEAFVEKGIFDPATAKSFRQNILEKGNTLDPMSLYMNFRGKKPSITPLLKNRGLL